MTETKQIAIVLYSGLTALDALGPYEVLKMLPGAEIRIRRACAWSHRYRSRYPYNWGHARVR